MLKAGSPLHACVSSQIVSTLCFSSSSIGKYVFCIRMHLCHFFLLAVSIRLRW